MEKGLLSSCPSAETTRQMQSEFPLRWHCCRWLKWQQPSLLHAWRSEMVGQDLTRGLCFRVQLEASMWAWGDEAAGTRFTRPVHRAQGLCSVGREPRKGRGQTEAEAKAGRGSGGELQDLILRRAVEEWEVCGYSLEGCFVEPEISA